MYWQETFVFVIVTAISAMALGVGWVLTQTVGKIGGTFRERNSLRRELLIKEDAYEKSLRRQREAENALRVEQDRQRVNRWAWEAEKQDLEAQIIDLNVELANKDKLLETYRKQIKRKTPAAAATATDA